jgi:hypothetical protein
MEKVVTDEALARCVLICQTTAQFRPYQRTEHARLILLCIESRNAGPGLSLDAIDSPAGDYVYYAGFGIPAKAAFLRPAIKVHMVQLRRKMTLLGSESDSQATDRLLLRTGCQRALLEAL